MFGLLRLLEFGHVLESAGIKNTLCRWRVDLGWRDKPIRFQCEQFIYESIISALLSISKPAARDRQRVPITSESPLQNSPDECVCVGWLFLIQACLWFLDIQRLQGAYRMTNLEILPMRMRLSTLCWFSPTTSRSHRCFSV